MSESLALHGGTKAKSTPYTSTNRYGEEEIIELRKALDSGKLMGPGGIVEEFEGELASFFGVQHIVTVTSGTAALHTALCALGVSEGDEVITTPMTDIGTVAAILALHAVPIFADIDIDTRLIDPKSARSRISSRTKVIITVHMSGMPCDMDAFMAIGAEKGVKILEDCAQAHGGTFKGKMLGSIGDAAGFSMNESKQMTTGDGGFVATNDAETGRIASLFRDKTYLRDGSVGRGGQPIPFFALNYRANGLHAAVGRAQLAKLPVLVARRRAIASRYHGELSDLEAFTLPQIVDGGEPSWWPIAGRYTGSEVSRDDLVKALRAEGLSISTGMSPANNILRTELVRTKRYYPLTDEVPAFWRDVEYDADSCPNVDLLQDTVVRLPVDERYSDEDVEETIVGFKKVWRALIK
ncbi:MAG TPA: DegT/DnrJ/EryC1/StrS family aminotransferase [Candidatus Latescibacteria bacterium]|jgi:dTDP-4-amino-4,6-dideoxygalactose transaminase|nr:DegT/DnrJ/EryC1/StrS family aminotransferase [Candidatus Latescibacterota bacterium]MDP7363314.1 DegT/DnrJ/EryC1/StrS family aminotransferase [Candidatus Latescibacterota bacterium]MDP7634186.1 DegT/DnrJ/EryC1/StrS family aminotransferase [Candidatus Latescibacterota bacterium]HJN28730.1 DegT/DnrJ/EryC1/StrS family aminotransferase [Candidatus Latescibacterota bacterium]|tara:strand:- start:728 stop:1957 length:1230 start_codon:yes stop_codon:yes gene_type:complete